MIAAEGMRQRACALFYLMPYTGMPSLAPHPSAFYSLLLRAYCCSRSCAFDLTALSGRRCLVSFPLLGCMTVSLTCRYQVSDRCASPRCHCALCFCDGGRIRTCTCRSFRLPGVLPLNYSILHRVSPHGFIRL